MVSARDDAKLHNYLQLANDEGEKLLRNDENGRTAELYENDNEDENLYEWLKVNEGITHQTHLGLGGNKRLWIKTEIIA